MGLSSLGSETDNSKICSNSKSFEDNDKSMAVIGFLVFLAEIWASLIAQTQGSTFYGHNLVNSLSNLQ